MRRQTKVKLKQRFYSYLFDFKKGEENKLAERIVQDIEMYVLDLNTNIKKLQEKVKELQRTV